MRVCVCVCVWEVGGGRLEEIRVLGSDWMGWG